ncbi:hypothetical protein ACOSP7_024929 [Xanthoceras sorbifolium]
MVRARLMFQANQIYHSHDVNGKNVSNPISISTRNVGIEELFLILVLRNWKVFYAEEQMKLVLKLSFVLFTLLTQQPDLA